MGAYCTLILGGALLPAPAQALAAALCARRPYHPRGTLTPEGALARMAEERAPVFEFDGVKDGVLFPEIAAILAAHAMAWAWFVVDDDGDDGERHLAYLQAADGSSASFPTLAGGFDLAVRARGATPAALEEAIAWQGWLDALRLDLVPSAHAALESHHAQAGPGTF